MTEVNLGNVKGDTGSTGVTGADGNGIKSVGLISTVGVVKTYRILFDDDTYFDFEVVDGSNLNIVDNLSSESSTDVLSANQGRVLNLNKLDANQGIENVGKYLKVDSGGNVIPATGGGGSVDVVTEWESSLSDEKVPSEKLVKDNLDTKQATLVSGTNIKTINNESVLGQGNINISGGADIVTFCQDLIEAYTDYDMNVTVEYNLLTITLSGNGAVAINKTVELYLNDTLVDSETTDSNGVCEFLIDSPGLTYTVKYSDKVSKTVPTMNGFEWLLDGSETLVVRDGSSATVTDGVYTGGNSYLNTEFKIDNTKSWKFTCEINVTCYGSGDNVMNRLCLMQVPVGTEQYYTNAIYMNIRNGTDLGFKYNGNGSVSTGSVGDTNNKGWLSLEITKQNNDITAVCRGYSIGITNSNINSLSNLVLGIAGTTSSCLSVRNAKVEYVSS